MGRSVRTYVSFSPMVLVPLSGRKQSVHTSQQFVYILWSFAVIESIPKFLKVRWKVSDEV